MPKSGNTVIVVTGYVPIESSDIKSLSENNVNETTFELRYMT